MNNRSFRQRIFVAGHCGMVGSAIVRQLETSTDCELVFRTHAELDLSNQAAVHRFFQSEHIDQVYLAASKVGGIHANSAYPADFIYQNMMIECNVIHAAHIAGIHKLLFLGSSCIYPRNATQPIQEDALLTGTLEPTNAPYAISKIAGITLCTSYNRQYGRDYRCVMPTNLYGVNDNFHPENSHVIPALIRRFHEATQTDAQEVVIWGSGNARREFLHVDDMAEACIFVMNLGNTIYNQYPYQATSHINIGVGVDYSIRELADIISKITAFKGKLTFDASKPDGTPRKLLDITRLTKLGWRARIDFEEGLRNTFIWFLNNQKHLRA